MTGQPSKGEKTDAGAEKPPPSAETKKCGEAAVCASECPDDATSDACVEACVAGLSNEEIAKMKEVAACIDGSGCGDDDECVQQTCAAEIQACIGG